MKTESRDSETLPDEEFDELVRIQFDTRKSRLDALKAKMKRLGVKTTKDVVENSFMILDWVLDETEAGNRVGVMDGNTRVFQPLQFAPLTYIKQKLNENYISQRAGNITGGTATATGTGNSANASGNENLARVEHGGADGENTMPAITSTTD